MSVDATMLYETLYHLASKDSGCDLFGTNAPLAQEAFQRALTGMSMPFVWFEVPLLGTPRFDLHVVHSNADLHEKAPFASDAMNGYGELLNWYASEPREGGGLALAYDVGDGRIDAPAVHVNVNGAGTFDVEGFFEHVGRPDASSLYDDFAKRLPKGWRIWYFGVHPGRSGAPVRVDCFVGESLKRAYADEPAKLGEDLREAGFVVEDVAALVRIAAEVAVSPFGMELQFDVLSDGTVGRTLGISAQIPLRVASAARQLWEPDASAAQLMEFAVNSHAADARWQLIRGAMFSTAVHYGDDSRALYCVPLFVKFRVSEGRLFDTKVYLQAGAVKL